MRRDLHRTAAAEGEQEKALKELIFRGLRMLPMLCEFNAGGLSLRHKPFANPRRGPNVGLFSFWFKGV